MVVEKFVSGFWVLVPFELVTPGFLGLALFGHRLPFIALKEARARFNLSLTFTNRFRNNLQESL